MAEVPVCDVLVDAGDLNEREKGINQVLAKLRPDWKPEDVKIKDVGEFAGAANRTFVCYVTDTFDDGVIFRIPFKRFSKYLDEDNACTLYTFMNEIGVGPRVLCRLPEGMCYEFIKGRTYTFKNTYEFKNIEVGKFIAKVIAKVHSKKSARLAVEKYNMTPENYKWEIFDWVLKDWGTALAEEEPQKIFDSPAFPTKEEFLAEKQTMDDVIKSLGFDHVFSHNDCHFGNIIYNEEKGTASLVDYDVCAYNNQGFDIAEFPLCAAMGFFAVDRKGEPRTLNSPEYYRQFLRSYLEALGELDEWGRDVTDEDVENIYVKVRKMTLYNMLYIIGICVLMATKMTTTTPGNGPVQVMQTGVDVWKLYKEHKEEVLALTIPPAQ